MAEGFEPDIQLTDRDRSELASIAAMPGYRVIHAIAKSAVDKFALRLLNTELYQKDEIIARHLALKTAAQFYTDLTNRINQEIEVAFAKAAQNGPPIDVTSNLDLGAFANQYGESEYLEETEF